MSTIQNLKKAYQSQAVTKDTFTLEKFFAKYEENDVALMTIVGVETKYIPQFDKRLEGGSLGQRTRFILADGTTIGSFSNAAFRFFDFFAKLMGYEDVGHFLHIDIDGQIVIKVSVVDLGKNAKGEPTYTYNFDIQEEGSELNGLHDYLPTAADVLALGSGEADK